MARGKKKEELSLEEKLEQALVPVEEWPYKVPENWCWMKLEFACSGPITDGTHKTPTYCEKNDGVPFVSAKDITSEYIDWSNVKYIVSDLHQELYKRLAPQKNDILLAKNGTTGVAALVETNDIFDLYVTIAVLRPNIGIMRPKFLYRLINSPICKKQFDSHLTGIGVPNLHLRDIKNIFIPLPPLAEQQRIVERVESLFAKLDEAKEKAQAVVDGFELRNSAILHKAFTGKLTERWRKEHGLGLDSWEKTNIGSISDVKGGKRVPKGMALTTDDTGHPYIKAGNLKLGTVLDEGILFVPDDVLQHIRNYTVNAGDVYITNVGACIGDCGTIPDKYDGANLTENAVKMTNLKCSSQFLAWYISSSDVQQEIKKLIASATLGKLSIANIKTISVSLPTSGEQAEIVRILKDLQVSEEQAKGSVESVLDQIDIMKKAILARAFRGELGTNDPTEESAVEMLKKIL